jgi:Cyclic nucleotide-binding domain
MRLLREALSSPDPWLRAAATVAFHAESGALPEGALQDPAPIVAKTARKLAQRPSATRCAYHEDAPMNRLAFLHTVPLFAGGSLDDLVAVDAALTCENYLKGEAIVTEGELGDRLFIVFRGAVAVRKRLGDGERELARLAPGDFFGEMSLFDDETRSATVAAVDEVEVLVLNRDQFHSLVQQRPSILMELCVTLVRRLRKAIS